MRGWPLTIAALVVAAVVVWFLLTRTAQAQPYSQGLSITQMMRILNGTATRQGVCTSTGTSATVAITAGEVVMVECDAAAHVGMGSSCSASYTNAAYCPKLNAAPDRTFFVANGTSLSCISSSGTANCPYFYMR